MKRTSSSQLPYEWRIGWRYTRAGRVAGRNGFISFISGVSMLGIALGVAALIIVLSVMNGFQKEVRDRMLAVVSHIELTTPSGDAFADVDAVLNKVRQHSEVVAAAPFVAQQALLARGEDMRGALVRGIDPADGVVARATDLGAITSGSGSLAEAVRGASVVVVGAPVGDIPQVVHEVLAVAEAAAREQDGQVLVAVGVGVAEAASVEDLSAV